MEVGTNWNPVCSFLLVINSNWSYLVPFRSYRNLCSNCAPTWSLWLKISTRRGRPPRIIFARLVRPINALQLCRWQFSHKELNFIADFLQAIVRFFTQIGSYAFLRPPLEDLGATYDDHLRIIGKRVDYSINWTFFAFCYGWGATSDYQFKIGDFVPTVAGWPKTSGTRGRPQQPFFFSEN